MAEANGDCMTNATASTRGGMSYEQLCRGGLPSKYVCSGECLVEITREDTLETAEKKLVDNVEKLFLDIEIQRGVKIKKFYIGKTFAEQNQTCNKFDPLNPNTWRKEGISSRWRDHGGKDYGKDGMIVIAVITRLQVPVTDGGKPVVHQELYTLALEQRLLHHYKITKGDVRLENDTFTSGKREKKESAGHVLYVAFSFTDKEVGENNNDDELPSSGQPLDDPTAGNINQDGLESTTEQTAKMSISGKTL